MNATGKRRLLKLADFLETANLPGGFDMLDVCLDAKNGMPECGTTACAIGWATAIPSFRRSGLQLSVSGSAQLRGLSPRADFSTVCAHFFDISKADAMTLFGPHQTHGEGLRGRRDAVARIRQFVSEESRAA